MKSIHCHLASPCATSPARHTSGTRFPAKILQALTFAASLLALAFAAPAPQASAAQTKIVTVAAGDYHSLCRTSDGKLWAMGQNYYGQLGVGDTTNRATPVQVPGVSDVVAVAAS